MFWIRLSKQSFTLSSIFIAILCLLSSCSASYRTYRGKASLEHLKTPTLEIDGVQIEYRDTLQYPSGYTPDGKPVGRVPIKRLSYETPITPDSHPSGIVDTTRYKLRNLQFATPRGVTFRLRHVGTFRF